MGSFLRFRSFGSLSAAFAGALGQLLEKEGESLDRPTLAFP